MAEVQESGPLVGYNVTDIIWRGLLGSEPAILGDHDGSAFGLTRPPTGDTVELGSTTVDSLLKVGGFLLRIPAGTTQSLTIPPSTNAAVGRTDLIVARLAPATYTTPPGPVRLFRIPGTEGSAARPSYTDVPSGSGIEHFPLYAINRKQGQALTESTATSMRIWAGPHVFVGTGVSTFPSMPIGSTATRGGVDWSRELVSGTPTWVEKWRDVVRLTGVAATDSVTDFWQRQDGCEMFRDGKWRSTTLVAKRKSPSFTSTATGSFGSGDVKVMRLHPEDRPIRQITASAQVRANATGNSYQAGCKIDTDGWVWLTSTNPNVPIGPDGPFSDTFRCHVTYYKP